MENVQDKLRDWLVACISGIVSKPDEVQVDASEDDMGLFFVVRVNEADRGAVIGKDGKHADALRTLLRCAGGLNDARASMKVEIPGRKYTPDRFKE